MELDTYIAEIKKFLIEKNNYTEEQSEKLIKNYEDDLQEFLDNDWRPDVAGTAMMNGY